MVLHFLNYNNYYNRIIKKFDTIAEYSDYVIGSLTDTNFNPNDGVEATHVINWNNTIPNYMIAVYEDNEINSRWFVIECIRLRNG